MGSALHLGWPNRITIGRLLLICPFAVCLVYLNEPGHAWLRWLAVVIFAVMTVSDALDGQLARYLGDVSTLGKFLDALADYVVTTVALLILCLIGIRGMSGSAGDSVLRLPWWVAATAVGKDLLVTIGVLSIYLSAGRFFTQARLLGKACRDVQFALVLSILLWPDLPRWLSGLPELLWYLATALAVAATLDYVWLGSRYFAAVAVENPRQREGK